MPIISYWQWWQVFNGFVREWSTCRLDTNPVITIFFTENFFWQCQNLTLRTYTISKLEIWNFNLWVKGKWFPNPLQSHMAVKIFFPFSVCRVCLWFSNASNITSLIFFLQQMAKMIKYQKNCWQLEIFIPVLSYSEIMSLT